MNRIHILIIFIIIILGFLSGLVTQPYLTKLLSIGQKRSSIPLPVEFLVNPVLDQLFASAEGIVIAKTADAMTLQKDGQQLTIFIEEGSGLTSFTEKNQKETKSLQFSNIKVGDYLKGGVSVIPPSGTTLGFMKPRKPGDVIAHRFTVTRQ